MSIAGNLIRPLGRAHLQAIAISPRVISRQNHTATSPNSQPGALHGVKILDLTRVLAGPFCTQILADYGADVLKVENPKGGDDTRLWRTKTENRIWKPSEKDVSAYFCAVNRNKRSVTLNLKHEKARDIILRLAKWADVVVDNFIPGKMEELGIGYETLKQVNPSIIHASVTGYGAQGPYSRRAGYDVIAAAEAGLLHITGESNGPPAKPGLGLTDMCTGLYLHGALLAALYSRQQTGRGQKIDGSLFETQISLLTNVAMSWLNNGESARDGELSIPFSNLCQLLGKPELVDDPRFKSNNARVENRVALKDILDDIFKGKTTNEWLDALEGSGMPYGPINNMEQVFSHPQTEARGMVRALPHQAAEKGEIKVLGNPVKFSETSPQIRTQPPSLGEHTDTMLEELGLSKEEIKELRSGNVL
ncbi:CoA-transferase family III [Aspergillus sclerotialis]|uniref:CoA-transferase family III n=1 Tax=Aspergillus sclerotialis TaxID=2070753 RepID=A0A3A2ZLN7_9EURO|nr:CoA-transferase family III [Aspergillus sclerotialis]